MVIGRAELELLLPSCFSLKDKRQVVRSLLERLRHRFNLAVAEVDGHGHWNRAVIGLACVSNDRGHASQILEQAVRFIEGDGRCEVTGKRMEVD